MKNKKEQKIKLSLPIWATGWSVVLFTDLEITKGRTHQEGEKDMGSVIL